MIFSQYQADQNARPPVPRREKLYLDHRLQKYMLIALVVLETIVLTVSLFYLYVRFDQQITQSLYQIHPADNPSLGQLLLMEVGKTIGVLVLLNLLALWLADQWWTRYVYSVLSQFRTLMNKNTALDLRPDAPSVDQKTHLVLDLTLFWRKRERERALKIQNIMEKLPAQADFSNPEVVEKYRKLFKALRRELPLYSRRFVRSTAKF